MERSLYDVKVLRSYTGTEGRVILFCFCRAASIILSRLLEANPSGSSFKNIYIVAMPWPDQISGAGGRDDIEAYRKRTGKTLTRDQLNAMCLRETYYHFRNCLWLDGVAESTPDESSAFRAAGGAVESK